MKAKGAGRAMSGRRKTAGGLRERRTEQTRAREWSTGHVGPTGAAVLAQPQSPEDVTSEWSGVEAERGRRRADTRQPPRLIGQFDVHRTLEPQQDTWSHRNSCSSRPRKQMLINVKGFRNHAVMFSGCDGIKLETSNRKECRKSPKYLKIRKYASK